MKKTLALVGAALASGAVMAQESSSFDPSTLLNGATTTVTAVATAVGAVLVAAAAIYLAFIGWRKFKDACNKI